LQRETQVPQTDEHGRPEPYELCRERIKLIVSALRAAAVDHHVFARPIPERAKSIDKTAKAAIGGAHVLAAQKGDAAKRLRTLPDDIVRAGNQRKAQQRKQPEPG